LYILPFGIDICGPLPDLRATHGPAGLLHPKYACRQQAEFKGGIDCMKSKKLWKVGYGRYINMIGRV